MDLNNNCCNLQNLNTIIEVIDEEKEKITLLQCPNCKTHWLYRKLRYENNKFEKWLFKINNDDLQNIILKNFELLKPNSNYIYITNIHSDFDFNILNKYN